ncbi:MAG: hypothetical protein LBH21_08575 [Gracilibacteraceae bacterium]|nr:hypothetical protein [Gracilibacteraceae bacterium]
MTEPRKKKFFAALSLTKEEARDPVCYYYDESCEISDDPELRLQVNNPVMAFIMDRVTPGEEVTLYLVVCKGDCLGDGKHDYSKRQWAALAAEETDEHKQIIEKSINARLYEITGDKEISLEKPYAVPAEPNSCDLAEVKRAFKFKNGAESDFNCRIEFITDDDENKEPLYNSSKSYVRLLLQLIELIEDDDLIFVDTTYGNKPLVNIWRSLCTYALRVKKGVQIGAFSYGSLHGITSEVPIIFNHRAFLVMDEILSNSYDNESGGIVIRGLLNDLLQDGWDYTEDEDDDGEEL